MQQDVTDLRVVVAKTLTRGLVDTGFASHSRVFKVITYIEVMQQYLTGLHVVVAKTLARALVDTGFASHNLNPLSSATILQK